MISQVFTQDCFKILAMFSLSPGSRFNRNEIKEKVKMNNVPLDAALSRLLSSEVLNKEGNYYSLNLDNNHSGTLIEMVKKQHRKLKEIPLDIYYILIDFVYNISVQKGAGIFLFGSYSKMIYTDKSDVDIAVLTVSKTDKQSIKEMAVKLEKLYNKNIELHFFDKKSFFKNKKDPLVKEIIKNGVKII